MKKHVLGLVIAATWILAISDAAVACNGAFVSGIRRTQQMVSDANLILRVTAVDYSVPPAQSRKASNPPNSKVRFLVEEVVKGSYEPREIVLTGILNERDEWNLAEPPYFYSRRSADAGCFTYLYRTGAQYLVVLKRNGKEYSTNWLALAPVNEQLRSSEDPWVAWVRGQVKR